MGALTDPVVLLALRVSVVFVAAAAAARMLRRRTAAARHAVWASALGAALALPLLSAVLPALRVTIPGWLDGADVAASVPSVDFGMEGAAVPPVVSDVGSSTSAPQPGAVVTACSAANPLCAFDLRLETIWLAVALLLLAMAVHARVRLAFATRRAAPLRDGAVTDAVARVAREFGLRRRIRLLEGDAYAMPATYGALRATLLLPSSSRLWSPSRLEAVLRHELAHIRRRDALTQLLSDAAVALCWFHPMVWFAAWQLRIEREHACDDAVLMAGARASDYAAELLDIAHTLRVRASFPEAALAMARASRLRTRIQALLEDRPRAHRIGLPCLVAGGTCTLAFACVLAAATPVAATLPMGQLPELFAAPRTAPQAVALRAATAVAAPVVERAAHATGAELQCFADGAAGSRSATTFVSGHSGPTRRIIQTTFEGVSLCMLTSGDVTFDAAASRIESLGEDAHVILEARGGSGTRLLEIRRDRSRWVVDGSERAFDDEAREWRDAMIGVLALQFNIASLRGEDAALRGRIASERGRHAAMRGEIASIRGAEAAMRGEIAAARGSAAVRQGEVAAVRGQEQALRGQLTAIRAGETAIRGELTALRASLEAMQDERHRSTAPQGRSDVDRRMGELRAAIAATERRLAEYGADARVTEAERRLEEYRGEERAVSAARSAHVAAEETERRVAEVQRRLTEHATESRVAAVERRIAEHDVERRVAEVQGQIESLDASRRTAEMESRLATRADRLRALVGRIR